MELVPPVLVLGGLELEVGTTSTPSVASLSKTIQAGNIAGFALLRVGRRVGRPRPGRSSLGLRVLGNRDDRRPRSRRWRRAPPDGDVVPAADLPLARVLRSTTALSRAPGTARSFAVDHLTAIVGLPAEPALTPAMRLRREVTAVAADLKGHGDADRVPLGHARDQARMRSSSHFHPRWKSGSCHLPGSAASSSRSSSSTSGLSRTA